MEMNEYQHLAARTINTGLNIDQQRAHALHEMSAEVGEIHGVYQKFFQGHDVNENDLRLEVGDLLWGIAEFCTAQGWALEDVARANIDKLRKRYPDGFDAEKSLHREEELSPAEKQIMRTIVKR